MLRIFYKKNGQIAPFMLAIIAILIMAVMVTVNVGKISLTKTHSANAADAGSLAGASVMANIFNMLADANSQMITKYDIFFATVTALILKATVKLMTIQGLANDAKGNAETAKGEACPDPCSAKAHADGADQETAEAIKQLGTEEISDSFMWQIAAIATEITAYYLLQWNFYNEVRDAALEGHTSAVRLSFQLAFSNSGISEKLISGSPPPEAALGSPPSEAKRRGDVNNYQLSFSDFVDRFRDGGIAGNPAFSRLNYPWTDGQSRAHDVAVDVTLDPPERYEVRVTFAPYLIEMGYLAGIEVLAYSVRNNLLDANMHYQIAKERLATACACVKPCITCCRHDCEAGCPCCETWKEEECPAAEISLAKGIAANSAAIGGLLPPSGIIAIYPILILAAQGVEAEVTGRIAWKGEVTPFGFLEPDILAWIEDVGPRDEHPHNGVVRVHTTQTHAGGPDLGLWQTRYPDITSFSLSNFRRDRFGRENRGRIYEPNTHHDATITQTD